MTFLLRVPALRQGAGSLALSMKVAWFVMTNAKPGRYEPNSVTIAAPIARSAAANLVMVSCVASCSSLLSGPVPDPVAQPGVTR